VSAATRKLITLGRVSGVFGVKGWLKIRSFTEPPGNIADYPDWILRSKGVETTFRVESGREHGGGVIAKLVGLDDRDQALAFRGAEILIERARLPRLAPDEYYWTDLEGLEVRTPEGVVLGKVDHLLATGGNDVLVVHGERERLVPFVLGSVIARVDLEGGVIVADWPPDF
jgi:16S rRNA processing protein RimM